MSDTRLACGTTAVLGMEVECIDVSGLECYRHIPPKVGQRYLVEGASGDYIRIDAGDGQAGWSASRFRAVPQEQPMSDTAPPAEQAAWALSDKFLASIDGLTRDSGASCNVIGADVQLLLEEIRRLQPFEQKFLALVRDFQEVCQCKNVVEQRVAELERENKNWRLLFNESNEEVVSSRKELADLREKLSDSYQAELAAKDREIERLREAVETASRYLTCAGCGVVFGVETHNECCPTAHRETWPHEFDTKRCRNVADLLVQRIDECEKLRSQLAAVSPVVLDTGKMGEP